MNGKGIAGFDFVDNDDRLDQPVDIGIAGFDFVDGDDRLDQPADIDVVYVLLREIIGFDSLISILKLRGTTYNFTQQKAFQCIGDLIYGHRQKLDVFASKSLGNKREVKPALNSIW
ncbi:hypothetical protein Tco_0067075 [Tanacetum coccineum]